jgi:hypothetical protein
VRGVKGRGVLGGSTGPSSFLYNHFNGSFRGGEGLFDPGVLVARPFLMPFMLLITWPLRALGEAYRVPFQSRFS